MSDQGIMRIGSLSSRLSAGQHALEHALTRVINQFSAGSSEATRIPGLAVLVECVREGAGLAEMDARLRQLSREGYLRDAIVAVAAGLLHHPANDVALRLAEELCDALDLDLGIEIGRALIQIHGASSHAPARHDIAARANLLLADTFAHQSDHESAARHYDAVLAYEVDHERALRGWARCMDVLELRGHRSRGGSRGLELVSGLESLELAGQPGLERYEISRPLGRGRHAVVYEAWDRQVGRRVALKRLLGEAARKDGLSDRIVDRHFFAEARTLSLVRSPYVVALLDVQARHRFVALELCEGGNLRRAMRRGVVQKQALAEIAPQLESALQAVHSAGAIHRDVKPANLLLRKPGSLAIALADFGVAVEGDPSKSRRHGRAGTLRYLAPELRRGGRATPSSDFFSAGAVLLEIAMHPTPLPEAFDRLDDPGEARDLVPKDLPDEVHERLIAWLHPDPEKRQ